VPIRYQLQQFKKLNPQKFNTLTNQLCAILDEMDEEMAKTIGI
jgi:DNA-directed RNA polymerase subunit F